MFKGMVDDEHVFVLSGGDVPGSAEELDGVGRTDPAGEVEGKMQVEEFFMGSGSQFGTLLRERFVPGCIGGEASSAMWMSLIVASDFGRQELIGLLVVYDFLVEKERHEALLEGAEEAFDLAFGLRGRGDAMVDAEGGQGALKLAGGILPIGGRVVAEET